MRFTKKNAIVLISIPVQYELKESEVIKLIEESKYGEVFNRWRNAKSVYA